MEISTTICPVCTLYLREGVTLQAHLETHPKEQVIEALLQLSNERAARLSQTIDPPLNPYVPVQSYANSNSSIITQTASQPFLNINPQTQMTTAVTYQHFMTSNGSTIMPHYIQVPAVVNPNSHIPVISQQALNYVPNPSLNYPHTAYNPLYNPYIPQPYPFTPPFFTGFPVSAQQPVDSNTQTDQNLNSSAPVNNSQGGTLIQPSVLVKKCTVATSTELDKRNSKVIGTKKSCSKRSATRKKVKLVKQKPVESTSSCSMSKSPGKGFSGVGKAEITSVIRKLRSKIASAASSSTNSRIVSPPPLTPIMGATTRSISGTKTPSPPPLAKAPYYVPEVVSLVDGEDVTDCAGPQSTSEINERSNETSHETIEYLGHHQKSNSVIVDSSNLIHSSNKSSDASDSKENEESNESEIVNVVILSETAEGKETEAEALRESAAVVVSDPLADANEDVTIDVEFCEEEEENQEKVFELIEVVEESKIDVATAVVNQDIPREISSENIERNCDGSDIFIQQENILFNEESERERTNDNNSYSEVVDVQTVEPSHKTPTEYDYGFHNGSNNSNNNNKEFIQLSSRSEDLRAETDCNSFGKQVDSPAATYTDLQPAKSTRLFQDLGISPAVNLSNYVEVEGIKIFFNNGSNVPFEPVMKLTPIQANGRNIALMKTENHPAGDSVIQLMSGKHDSQNEMSFGENYPATTSQVNDVQVDFPDLSPVALNIQADESMPARGELSEQESLGAENSTWNLFHGNNVSSGVSTEERKPDLSQSVTVIGVQKIQARKFKCWSCEEVFSCSKERRVHNNTVHVDKAKGEKSPSSCKKPKSYECSFCSQVFTCIRDRKAHVVESHYPGSKTRKEGDSIKEDETEAECSNSEVACSTAVKNETTQDNVKTETALPPSEADSHRIKYCSRCSLPFGGVKKLREHLRLVHGEIRFKCEKCLSCFDEETEYNDHLLVHPLVCDKCGKTFHRRPNLNLHMKRHLEVKPYECNLCPKSFVTRQKLEEHMNGHSGKKPIKCTLCDKTFSRHSNLIQHRNLHHLNVKKKIKDFVCRCGEVFHSLRKLEWHKEVHEPKPKPCPFCSQKFIHSASVTRHIRRAHLPDYLPGDNREYDNVQCPICEKVYLRSSLVVHMRVHNGEKPFACKVCNKRFSTKWNLELHNWTHQSRSNMPFKCQVCKSAFFRETDFVAHLNSHRNYKPFTCNICGQKFIRKYSCLRHQEEHKKSKQYVCAVSGCAKTFHRGYYLKDHMKVHTGVRPHTCHICGKASSTKSNHNKHVRIHDTREPVNTEN